jgi:hypothetical protein
LLTLEYDLSVEDMIALGTYHAEHSPGEKRRYRLFQGVILAIVLVLIVSTVSTVLAGQTPDTPAGLAIALLPLLCPGTLLFLVFSPAVRRWSVSRAIRRAFPEDGDPSAVGRQRLTLAPDALHLETHVTEIDIPWGGIREINTTKDHIFVHTEANQAFVVPRTAFSSQTAFESFIDTLHSHAQQARD